MFEQRLEKADELRTKGNEFLKEGDYAAAQLRYYAAIFQLDFSMAQYGEGAKKYEDQINTRKLRVISNIAVARFQHKDYMKCKDAIEVGLKITSIAKLDEETTNSFDAKFWYLKGKSNLERGFSEEAVEALKKAQAITPTDKQVHEALTRALAEKKEDKVTSKEVWKQKLLTKDEVLAQGPWYQKATLLAKLRERVRLKGCCGHRRQVDQAEEKDSEPSATRPSCHSYARPRCSSSRRNLG